VTDSSAPSPAPPSNGPRAEIGVIGGSGLYSWLTDAVTVQVTTPFGPPSDPPVLAQVAGRSVAFLPRHGHDHRHPPHRVNYRANLWALRSLGVRQVVAACAVGSLQADIPAGSLVSPDQVIDRTWGRERTVYDDEGAVVHVPFADPYCERGRQAALSSAARAGVDLRDGATLVVVNGPRFSSRAESRWHAATGGNLVGMTGMPEASLARELALCYSCLAVVTDLDAGVEAGTGVTHGEVMAMFAERVEVLRSLLHDVVAALPPTEHDCVCRHGLDGQRLPFPLP
jgi:5'-methylthioadenosine phosphorylase